MATTLLTTGLACLIAAIVGGGLKAFGIEIPILRSGKRQLALAGLGFILALLAPLFRNQGELGSEPALVNIALVSTLTASGSLPTTPPTLAADGKEFPPPGTQEQGLLQSETNSNRFP